MTDPILDAVLDALARWRHAGVGFISQWVNMSEREALCALVTLEKHGAAVRVLVGGLEAWTITAEGCMWLSGTETR